MGEPLELLIERIVQASPAEDIAAARAAFEARTGAFQPEEPFYEERLRASFDDAVTAWGNPRAVLLRRFLASSPDAAPLLRTWRTLLAVERVDTEVLVRAPLTGAELSLVRDEGPSGRLREGDLFDGRVVVDEGVRLLPGALFFERDAHQAIFGLVDEAARARRSSDATCDALLRMQMRLFRQPALRVHHVYRWDAFDRMEILAAPWARPKR